MVQNNEEGKQEIERSSCPRTTKYFFFALQKIHTCIHNMYILHFFIIHKLVLSCSYLYPCISGFNRATMSQMFKL